jgi:hypothetical protein
VLLVNKAAVVMTAALSFMAMDGRYAGNAGAISGAAVND